MGDAAVSTPSHARKIENPTQLVSDGVMSTVSTKDCSSTSCTAYGDARTLSMLKNRQKSFKRYYVISEETKVINRLVGRDHIEHISSAKVHACSCPPRVPYMFLLLFGASKRYNRQKTSTETTAKKSETQALFRSFSRNSSSSSGG